MYNLQHTLNFFSMSVATYSYLSLLDVNLQLWKIYKNCFSKTAVCLSCKEMRNIFFSCTLKWHSTSKTWDSVQSTAARLLFCGHNFGQCRYAWFEVHCGEFKLRTLTDWQGLTLHHAWKEHSVLQGSVLGPLNFCFIKVISENVQGP
jgi:hypothetical protein